MRLQSMMMMVGSILAIQLSGCYYVVDENDRRCMNDELYLVEIIEGEDGSKDPNYMLIQECELGCNLEGDDCADYGDPEDGESGDESNECHPTGHLECSGGSLYKVRRCDDGSKKLEYGYTCPCGCWQGSSTCKFDC